MARRSARSPPPRPAAAPAAPARMPRVGKPKRRQHRDRRQNPIQRDVERETRQKTWVQPGVQPPPHGQRCTGVSRARTSPRPRPRRRAAGEATPMVERACRPASPKAATVRSEAPFITTASCTKSGAQAMKPPRRTNLAMLASPPGKLVCSCASTLIRQSRAACWPSSMVTPPAPVCRSPRPCHRWPAIAR